MTNVTSDGKAVTSKKNFSRETVVSIDIQANKSIIWALLTNAEDYRRWNSTIISIEGDVAKGEKIKLKSALDPKRTFKLKVKEFEPGKRLVWGDAMGKRIYILKTIGDELTNFVMAEKISGPMFPLFAKMIPPFDQSFEKFAHDLKKEAELIQNSK
jgi:uncharacterized protein YndB with AHSA1/START domain